MENIEMELVVGVGLFLFGLGNYIKALLRRRWPSTVGIIQTNETTLEPVNPTIPDDVSALSKHTGRLVGEPSHEKCLRLVYVFVLGKYKYLGRTLYSAPIFGRSGRVQDLSVGDKVKVFYNPANPHSCFLAHSYSWPSFLLMFVGVGVVAYWYINYLKV